MNGENRVNQSSATTLVALLVVFALLSGLYYSLRYGGWSMEGDASSQTTSALGVLRTGNLLHTRAYDNGYGYSAQLAFLSLISGLTVQGIQQYSSLWVVVVALTAFITYREYLGSAATAALGVALLFLQPDFLFYIVRGAHEKFTWAFALLMLFLLARSYRFLHQSTRLLVCVGLFYIVFWGFTAFNVYFAASYLSAILLSFIGGWALSRLGGKHNTVIKPRAMIIRRLTIISLACFILVYIFINYTYPPAMQFYNIFLSLFDKVGLLVLGTQEAVTPASYAVATKTWRSQEAYLALTGWQWLISLASIAAWGTGLARFKKMAQNRWLIWLMYSSFGVLLVVGVIADFAGFLNVNLQLRMFTPFTLFSSPLVAELVARGFRGMRTGWRWLAIGGLVIMLICGAAAVMLKVTNDPMLGNQWIFYTPAELAPASWLNHNQVSQQEVWVDTWEHLPGVFYFWEGYRPIRMEEYLWGRTGSVVRYTLISELARLRANRSGISLPDTNSQLQVYDNGTVQLYHRRPVTTHQR